MFKSTEKELLDKIDNLNKAIVKLKVNEEKIKHKVKTLDKRIEANNQIDTLSDLLEQLICNRNIWLSFDYNLLKMDIQKYLYQSKYIFGDRDIDSYTINSVLKRLDYPKKNAEYLLNFCLNHKSAYVAISPNAKVVDIYDTTNANDYGYPFKLKDYLLISSKRPTETDYKKKYKKLKRYGHDIDDKECQVDRPISDSFYCKKVPVLDLLKNILKGEQT